MAYRFNICPPSIEVNEKIDAGLVECLHAIIMIGAGINMIYSHRIGAELLHQLAILPALVTVRQAILRAELVGNTC